MTKQWRRREDRIFEFLVNGIAIGTMEIVHGNLKSKAICTLESLEFSIKPAGSLTTALDVAEIGGEPIAIVRTEHWYSDYSVLEFEGKQFILRLHNDPLATWSIFSNDKPVLSYGLQSVKGRLTLRINTEEDQESFIPDFLLWYLFVPIANENIGEMLDDIVEASPMS
jgi:hypothetical protein